MYLYENQGHLKFTNILGGNIMAKAGMRRPDPSEPHGTESNIRQEFDKNKARPVPEIKGKAKSGHKKAKSI